MTLLGKALAAQLVGSIGALAAGKLLLLPAMDNSLLTTAIIQGMLAALVSGLLRLPGWWLPIQLLFCPLAVLALRLGIPPWVWLTAFVMMLLVFWRTDSSRVPLYLSNATTATTVAGLIPPGACAVLDVGCGSGSLLVRLARARPDCRFIGIEHAPLTWLFAWLRCRGHTNIAIRRGDFWLEPLDGYRVVYAFLSPVPMQRLWEKTRRELAPDALLISNSFAVPTETADTCIEVADRRQTRLYCYRPGNK